VYNERVPHAQILLTLLVTLGASASRPASRPAPTSPSASASAATTGGLHLERGALDNGLRSLLLRDPGAPMVGVFALIRAGALDEQPGESGLSHFLEHLLFNGTEGMSQEELYAAVDRLGAYSNATTRVDHTLFQMLLPTEHLERALAIHAAMLFRSTIPASKFDKERGIVLEELAKDAARPETAIEDAFRRLVWDGTPLAQPVIGTKATLGSIPRDDVIAYWRRRYVPANVTVLVVGNVTPTRMHDAVAAAYGAVPAACAPPPMPSIVAPRDGRLQTMPTETGGVELRIAWPGPDPVHPDAAALDVLASLLNDGPQSSLTSLLGDADMVVTSAGADLDRIAGTTSFTVRVSAAAGTPHEPLITATIDSIERAARTVSEAALSSVKTRLATAGAFLAEKPHYFGLEKAALLIGGGAGAVEGEAIGHARVDRAAIGAAASTWLGDRPYRALAAGPGLPASTLSLAPISAARADVDADNGTTEQRTTTLANGLRLLVSSNPATSVLAIHVLLDGRSAREPIDRPGLADLVHRLLTRRDDAFERDLAAIGAVVKSNDLSFIPYDDYYYVPDYSYVRVETIDPFAERVTPLLTTMLGPLSSAPSELAPAQAAQLDAAGKAQRSARARSATLLARTLYGDDHPLARPVAGDPDALAGIGDDEVKAFARAYLDPAQMIVTVETGRPADEMLKLLGDALGTLTTTPGPRPSPPPQPPVAGRRLEEELGGGQAYVRMGARVEVGAAQLPALIVAAAVLSDRLASDIRETRGMAYSIGAGITLRPTGAPDVWSAAAGTRPENVDVVVDAMRANLARLHEDGPSDDEVRLAASRLIGRQLMRRLSGIGRAHATGLDLWRGEEPLTGLRRIEGLADVDTAAVGAVLRQHFDPGDVSVAIVR